MTGSPSSASIKSVSMPPFAVFSIFTIVGCEIVCDVLVSVSEPTITSMLARAAAFVLIRNADQRHLGDRGLLGNRLAPSLHRHLPRLMLTADLVEKRFPLLAWDFPEAPCVYLELLGLHLTFPMANGSKHHAGAASCGAKNSRTSSSDEARRAGGKSAGCARRRICASGACPRSPRRPGRQRYGSDARSPA